MAIIRGNLVTPTGVITDGVIAASQGRITHVGPWAQAPAEIRQAATPEQQQQAPTGYVLPGLVDIHNHGGKGVSFPDTQDVEQVEVAAGEHSRYGTTHMLASLVTASPDTLRARVEMLAEACDQGVISGIHLEGPFISEARCGAQNPAHIIPGDPDLTADLLKRGRGHVRTMTLAAETPNLAPVVQALADEGAIPSFGHTDADERIMRDAIELASKVYAGTGMRATITHLFNGMRPIHHRIPGPVPPSLSAAARGEVVVELIGDGAHLHPGIVTDVFDLVGSENIALITDAMAATGMSDGNYRLGSLDVVVKDGIARLADGDSIAGGTAHLLDVVQRSVNGGVSLVDAVVAASCVPAQVISTNAEFGAIVEGYEAAFVHVDDELNAVAVEVS